MTISEASSGFSSLPRELATTSTSEGAGVRVGVHDASRVEWSVSVPLPEARSQKYSILVVMRIPRNTFVEHAPWDQMQSFARLDGPALSGVKDEATTIDALRRGAVGLANRLSRASEGFSRHCRLAASLFATTSHGELEESLVVWINAAEKMADEARARFTRAAPSEPAELTRERALVDEYVSIRLLEMLAGAERALGVLGKARPDRAANLAPVVASVEVRVASALGKEVLHREDSDYVKADPTSQAALEQYLDRASRLKKHFQEVLFLEAETYQVAQRIHNWVAAFVAVIASTWAFAWQIALMNRRPSTGSSVGSGLIVLAVIAGLVYATKDRIKEMGRIWISGKVGRVVGAQRVARYRAPARRLPGRDVIAQARESFDRSEELEVDPLNPEAGAHVPISVLTYDHKGEVLPQRALSQSGVRRIKHVFRYDLSPLFARLDDALKPIPVLDEVSRRVRFIDAPRCYRVPISVRVVCGGVVSEQNATLILHKRGLDRIEHQNEDREGSDPKLLDAGIEPG